jgi:hypothetical protein
LDATEVRLWLRSTDEGIGLGANGADRRFVETRAQECLNRQAGGRQGYE